MSEGTSYFPGFDVMKFIMAIIVVEIHTLGLHQLPCFLLNSIVRPLEDISVPLFFVFSSYLFFLKVRKMEFQAALINFERYERRICMLYLLWCIVNMFLVYKHKTYIQNIEWQTPLLFIKDFLTGYIYPSSWFFGALMVSVFIVFFVSRLMSDRIIWFIPFTIGVYTLYAKELSPPYDFFYNLYSDWFRDPNLSFPRALFYVSLGHLASNKHVMNAYSNIGVKTGFVFLLGALILWQVEPYSGIFMGVLGLFSISFSWELPHEKKTFFVRLRTYSIWFYCMHMLLLQIYKMIVGHFNLVVLDYNIFSFLFVLISLFVLSTILYKAKEYRYFSWLKYSF